MLKIRRLLRGISIVLIITGMMAASTTYGVTAATKARRIQDRAKVVLEDNKVAREKWAQFDSLVDKYANLLTSARGAHRRLANFCAAYGYMPTERIIRKLSATQTRDKQDEYHAQQLACDRLEDVTKRVDIALKKLEDDKIKINAEIDTLDARKQAATNDILWPPELEKRLADANKKLNALGEEATLLVALRDEAASL